jgi:hypothetical protein
VTKAQHRKGKIKPMPVKRGRAGVRQELHKFKTGTLHSGSKRGPIVTSRKQAIAIALSEAGLAPLCRFPIHAGAQALHRVNW